jgi:hypothetical protein
MTARGFLTFVVVATVAVMIAAAMLVVEQSAANPRQAGGDPMFPELKNRLEELDRLVIAGPRYSLTLGLRDGQWVAADFGDYPVNAEPFLQIVSSMLEMTRVEPKTDNPDLYQYLSVTDIADDETNTTLRIQAYLDDGTQVADALFGRESASIGFTRVGGLFVRPTDSEQAWLVEGFITTPNFLQDWFQRLLSIPGPDVASVSIGAGNTVLLTAEKIDFATADYELTFVRDQVAPDNSIANDANIRSMGQGVISTTFDSARPIGELTLSDADRVVTFVTVDGLELSVRLVEADGETWVIYQAFAAAGSEAAEEAAGITERTAQWAFEIPSHRVNALARPIEELFIPPEEEVETPRPFVPIAP